MRRCHIVRNRKEQSVAAQLVCLTAVVVCLLLSACAGSADRPTPDAARRFLKLRGYDFNEEGFFKAAENGDAMAVDGFVSAGINVNAKDQNGDTALTATAARGDAKIVDLLLRGGADVNAKGRNGWTALLLALQDEHDEATDILLNQPALDVKALTPEGMTSLMLAVWHQKDRFVRTLVQRGSELNHQDKDGDTAVHGAALYGNVGILGALLDAGANPNMKNKLGGTALMWAAAYGHDDVLRLLLSRGADPKLRDVDGVTAAGWAAKNGQANAEMILRAGEKSSQQ